MTIWLAKVNLSLELRPTSTITRGMCTSHRERPLLPRKTILGWSLVIEVLSKCETFADCTTVGLSQVRTMKRRLEPEQTERLSSNMIQRGCVGGLPHNPSTVCGRRRSSSIGHGALEVVRESVMVLAHSHQHRLPLVSVTQNQPAQVFHLQLRTVRLLY